MANPDMILVHRNIEESLEKIGEFLVGAKGKTEETRDCIEAVREFYSVLDHAWYRAEADVREIGQG
ncbi:MAG: hypothetical protein KKD18_01610 [Nanoarchaeota archaeon]|nr:hypothetical protein [Nanoarchaeota archaeon]